MHLPARAFVFLLPTGVFPFIACGGSTEDEGNVQNGVGGSAAGAAGGAAGGAFHGGTGGVSASGGRTATGGASTGGTGTGGGGLSGAGGAGGTPGTGGVLASGGTSVDAGVDAATDGCTNAVDGAPCDDEGASCGGPCTDPCSFCNIVTCQLGTWQHMEVFPAPCFDCGTERRCMAQSTYCDVSHSDIGGEPDIYTCMPMPSACSADPTCACIGGHVAADACTESEGGLQEV